MDDNQTPGSGGGGWGFGGGNTGASSGSNDSNGDYVLPTTHVTANTPGGTNPERSAEKAVRLYAGEGIKYTEGGVFIEDGMDCSGLMNATIFGNGIRKFWTGNFSKVKGWYYVGEGIKNAKALDIIVWQKSTGDLNDHMAYYMKENLIFHSSNTPGVAFTSLTWWNRRGTVDVYREDGYQ